jgi:hypothetical protein
MRASTRQFKFIADTTGGNGRRISFRFRNRRRPFQINFTITRYIPAKTAGRGVS